MPQRKIVEVEAQVRCCMLRNWSITFDLVSNSILIFFVDVEDITNVELRFHFGHTVPGVTQVPVYIFALIAGIVAITSCGLYLHDRKTVFKTKS
jgi:hypothetical protein